MVLDFDLCLDVFHDKQLQLDSQLQVEFSLVGFNSQIDGNHRLTGSLSRLKQINFITWELKCSTLWSPVLVVASKWSGCSRSIFFIY
jgi:hypothetical protein